MSAQDDDYRRWIPDYGTFLRSHGTSFAQGHGRKQWATKKQIRYHHNLNQEIGLRFVASSNSRIVLQNRRSYIVEASTTQNIKIKPTVDLTVEKTATKVLKSPLADINSLATTGKINHNAKQLIPNIEK